MEQITDYVVEETTNVEEVTTQELINVLMGIGNDGNPIPSQFVNVVMETEPSMNKTGNPFFGRVKKLSSRNYKLLVNYQKRVRKNEEKEGLEPDFVTEKPKGKHHVTPLVLMDDKTESVHYLNLEYFPEIKPKVSYSFDNLPMVEGDIELMKTYLTKKYESKKQEQERKVEVVTPKISNIKQITIEGVRYVVKN